MSKDIPRVIKTFSKFLDPKVSKKIFESKLTKKKIESLDDFLNLPIGSYKFLNESEAKILEEVLDIHDIGEAATLNKENPFKNLMELESTADPIKATEMHEELVQQVEVLKEKFPNLEHNLKRAISISGLIKDIKEKKDLISKKEQKIVVVGLDNAGKTAILSKFGGRLGITDLAKLKPTKGIDRKTLETEELDLIIWDFGGQEQYRENYLKNAEKFFFQSDLILYVIDVQDPDRFDESFDYFNKILNILSDLEENPYILVFFHKFDPDIKTDPEILLNIEYLKDKVKEVFEAQNLDFDYEIYLTSIFSLISNEPKFSKYIKDVMKTNESINLSDPTIKKVEGLGKILEETMNAIIRLSESISLQLSNLDERLRAIETGTVQIAETGEPLRTEAQEIEQRESNVRTSVLGELRDLFAKKKRLNL